MLLTSALLALGNMARGNATISHGQWLAYAAWVIGTSTTPFLALCWMYVVVIVTIRATKPLLAGINGDKRTIWHGFVRAAPIIPVLYFIPLASVFLLQGLVYYLVGKWEDGRATRVAEGICGGLFLV